MKKTTKRLIKRKPARKAIDKQLKYGDLVAVVWKDITMHDHIKSKHLKKPKFINYVTDLYATITYGMYIGSENGSILISQEYCEDTIADATMIEVIPTGVICKVMLLKVRKTINGTMSQKRERNPIDEEDEDDDD